MYLVNMGPSTITDAMTKIYLGITNVSLCSYANHSARTCIDYVYNVFNMKRHASF